MLGLQRIKRNAYLKYTNKSMPISGKTINIALKNVKKMPPKTNLSYN